jgi:hypothetical protein
MPKLHFSFSSNGLEVKLDGKKILIGQGNLKYREIREERSPPVRNSGAHRPK